MDGLNGEPMKSSPAASADTPQPGTRVEYWLGMPFDLSAHDQPLGGILSLENCTNLEVLARLVGLNECSVHIERFGDTQPDPDAPYGYTGLMDADEALLMTAMLNYCAGLLSAHGLGVDCLLKLIDQQIVADVKPVKH